MTRIFRSSRRPCCASRAKARPRSASSERSWNSSNRTAAIPFNSGSSRIMREKMPSVTTSMRVFFVIFDPKRTRSPTVSPVFSPSVFAMRSAAARAASLRGSSTMIFLSFAQGSSSSTSGTRVVLPAPGGATSTAASRARNAAVNAGSASSMGRGESNLIMRGNYSRSFPRKRESSAATLGPRRSLSSGARKRGPLAGTSGAFVQPLPTPVYVNPCFAMSSGG